jgi:hypothetical protein
MAEYPKYQMDIKVVGGEWRREEDGQLVAQPVTIPGIHAGRLMKNNVSVKFKLEHNDPADPFPHVVITFE